MISYSTTKVCRVCLTLCFALRFYTVVDAGLFSERTVYIESFKYGMCKPTQYNGRYNFLLRDLDIMSTSYGDVDFTGTFITRYNMTSPLKVTVNLKRNILGVNIKIPCIKNFGSCTFNDICKFGYPENEECPPLLEELDVPCRCPIEPGPELGSLERHVPQPLQIMQATPLKTDKKKKDLRKGTYNIPGVQLKEMAKSRWATLLAGKYTAIIKLYKGNTAMTCYDIKFTLN